MYLLVPDSLDFRLLIFLCLWVSSPCWFLSIYLDSAPCLVLNFILCMSWLWLFSFTWPTALFLPLVSESTTVLNWVTASRSVTLLSLWSSVQAHWPIHSYIFFCPVFSVWSHLFWPLLLTLMSKICWKFSRDRWYWIKQLIVSHLDLMLIHLP